MRYIHRCYVHRVATIHEHVLYFLFSADALYKPNSIRNNDVEPAEFRLTAGKHMRNGLIQTPVVERGEDLER